MLTLKGWKTLRLSIQKVTLATPNEILEVRQSSLDINCAYSVWSYPVIYPTELLTPLKKEKNNLQKLSWFRTLIACLKLVFTVLLI